MGRVANELTGEKFGKTKTTGGGVDGDETKGQEV